MTDPASTMRPPAAWRLWENPIFRRYCRSRLRARGLFPAWLITVIIAAFAYLITPMAAERMNDAQLTLRQDTETRLKNDPNLSKGEREWGERLLKIPFTKTPDHLLQRSAVIPLLLLQAAILFVLGTGQTAGGMTAERDEGMVDYQRLTPITPVAKVAGYLFGLPVREWMLFLSTMPFMVMAVWRGGIPPSVWAPVALIFFTSVTLYHLTGLVSGTVFKSRRWAFLFSMALVFVLYFVVPQGARYGLPFLRYMTMWPVVLEVTPHLFGEQTVQDLQKMSGHVKGAGVDFFEWNFSDLVFTLIVQGSLILFLCVMVWRKWRQAESHLLSKGWALLLFLWLSILPIGNAIPGIQDGSLFPERARSRFAMGMPGGHSPWEALQMCAFYGMMILFFLILMVIMLTPGQDSQARGLRRAAKLGRRGAPFFSDESSAFPVVLLLTAGGAASWAWFSRSVLGSTWFQADPGWTAYLVFFGILAPSVMGFHALLEARGGKWPFLLVVFLGVVPVLAALVVATASRSAPPAAFIVAGASPMTQTIYAAEGFIPWRRRDLGSGVIHDAVRQAIHLWPVVYAFVALFFLQGLQRHWKRRRA